MFSVSNIPVLKDKISSLVESIRPSGAISSITEESGNSKIFSTNNLVLGDVVRIDNVEYTTLEVNSDYFVVEGTGIVDDTWYGLAPYFMHGHIVEIVQRLKEKDESDKYRFQKYPLIVLVEDYMQRIRPEYEDGIHSEVTCRVIIMNLSDPDWYASDRYANNFVPVLYPLYVDFMNALIKADWHEAPLNEMIPHNPINRLAWGRQDIYGNEADVGNDHIDAIDIEDLVLRLKFNDLC